MAYFKIENVAIRGIAACVPAHVEENIDCPLFTKDREAERVIAQTKIERRHTVEPGTTLIDLFIPAFEQLIADLKWERESIDAIVVVSNSFEYIVPATACILQGRLNLSEDCHAFDIRQGCPGWVIGMSTLSSMISNGSIQRAILFAGAVTTLMNSPQDKETRPLFGDAGTVTALEFEKDAPALEFLHGTRGKDFKAIHTPCGGTVHPVDEESLKFVEYGENQKRRGIDCTMDGMTVFGFGLSIAPQSVNQLCEHFNIDKEKIDYFLFHQANGYMNEKIRKKLKIPQEKVPYCFMDYGNTSCASIPLTLVTQLNKEYATRPLDSIACAFGVGLAWGCLHFKTNGIVCPDIINYSK